MRRTFAYILVIILLNSGFAAAADDMNDVVTFHGKSSLSGGHANAALQPTANHHDTELHHVHHGCHMSSHMVALLSDTPSIKSMAGTCTPSYQNPIILTRRSAPPTRPPRV